MGFKQTLAWLRWCFPVICSLNDTVLMLRSFQFAGVGIPDVEIWHSVVEIKSFVSQCIYIFYTSSDRGFQTNDKVF